MTGYTIRHEFVWPDNIPEPNDEQRAAVQKWLDDMVKREFERLCNVPLPPPPPASIAGCACGKWAVVHRPNCPFWGAVT